MSGDNIADLKMVKEQPLNMTDLEFTQKLLEPFEDVPIVERFTATSDPVAGCTTRSRMFILIAIGLVLLINFPKIREKSGLNDHILWLISAVILFGVIY